MCPRQNCALLKECFIRGGLNWLFFKASFYFLCNEQDSDKQVFFSTTLQPGSLGFCRYSAVLSKYSHLFWSLCSFVRLLELLVFLCASPTSLLSFCLIGLIGDRGGRCPERPTYRQAGVPWQSPSGSPSRPCLCLVGFRPVRLQASLETSSLLPSLSRTLAMFTLHLNKCP